MLTIKVRAKDIQSLDFKTEQNILDDDYNYHTECGCGKYNYFPESKYFSTARYKVKCPHCKTTTTLVVW